MIHELKTWPVFFLQVVCGRKTFEIRENDRDFKSHDILRLREWNPDTKEYTGQAATFKVTYIMNLSMFGSENMVAMAIIPYFPDREKNETCSHPAKYLKDFHDMSILCSSCHTVIFQSFNGEELMNKRRELGMT